MQKIMWIVIKGDPVDGFEYIGPFSSTDDAEAYMDTESNDTTWMIQLVDPHGVEDDAA